MAHRWHFFRAGGVDQVSLRDRDDLLALKHLDQKLWVALAMPVKGVDIDAQTLALIDKDHDGRVRVVDILEAIDWLAATLKSPEDILRSAPSVKLSAIKDEKVLAAAKHMLKDLEKPDATEISVEDVDAVTKAFANTTLNGDGVVIVESTSDDELKKLIVDMIAAVGSVPDRSSKQGVDKAKADEFFAAVDKRAEWIRKGKDQALAPLGDATGAAHDAFAAVSDKLDDYFTRARIASYDTRGAATTGAQEADLVALSQQALSSKNEALGKLPLAKVDPAAKLAVKTGLNPAWADRMNTFVQAAVTPILGGRSELTAEDITQVADKLAGFAAWRAEEPKTKADALDPAWIVKLAESDLRKDLADLIARDAALASEYEQIASVARAVRMQRDGARILRNFVNFSDFYSAQDGVFQCGTLYLDARALHLCVPVADPAKHSALAATSDSYLAYLDITRKGETKHIMAAITNGDADNLFVGRNGVFYDRAGNDWDATITKLVANPISIREAFWSPYKKLVRAIEDTVQKRAAAADAEATSHVTSAGAAIGTADKAAVTPATAPAAAAATPPAGGILPGGKKIDLGTVAAIGVAIGGIGTLVGALLGSLFGLGKWLPFGIGAIMLLISGPAMLLAWLKLRRRNLGPILDANGWAVNGRARINVAFGAAMTEMAKLPKNSQRSLDDPFADKRTPWKRWVFLIVVLVLGGTWYVGKLDTYVPNAISSENVLGKHAPIVKAREEAAAEKAKADAAAEKAKAEAAEKAKADAAKAAPPPAK